MSDRKKRLTKALSMALGLLSMGGQFSSAADTYYNYGDGRTTQYNNDVDDNEDKEVPINTPGDGNDEEKFRVEVRKNIELDLKHADEMLEIAANIKRAVQALPISGASSETAKAHKELLDQIENCVGQCHSSKKNYFSILKSLDGASGDLESVANSADDVSLALKHVESSLETAGMMYNNLKNSLASAAASIKKDESSEMKLNLKSIMDRLDASMAALDSIDDKLRNNASVGGIYGTRCNELRATLASLRVNYAKRDGVVEREFATTMHNIELVNTDIEKLAMEVEDECTSLNVRTNYDVYTDTLTSLENQWADFLASCNPARLSEDMLETTRTQAMMSFERGRSVCEEIRKQLIDYSNKACEDDVGTIKRATSEVEQQCREMLARLSRAFAASKKMFEKAAQANVVRHKALSLTAVRQGKVKTFFKNCRSINARGNLSDAQKRSALLDELNSLLPGRSELHMKLMDVVVRPVEMNKQGRVEPSALQRKNILLIGNVGTGKTEEVNRVLDAVNVKSIFAKPGDFSTSDSANTFWENFLKETENSTSDVVIVFDEIESILPSRWGDQEVSPAVANFNIFMDKLASKPSLMAHYRGMIGTTNLSQERLDPALVSRIANVITVPSLSGDRLVEAVAGLTSTVTFDASCTKKEVNETIADIMERHNISMRDFINILESEVDKQRKLNVDPATGASTGSLVLKQDNLYASLRGLSLTDNKDNPAVNPKV